MSNYDNSSGEEKGSNSVAMLLDPFLRMRVSASVRKIFGSNNLSSLKNLKKVRQTQKL
jgi:hypothetical protein